MIIAHWCLLYFAAVGAIGFGDADNVIPLSNPPMSIFLSDSFKTFHNSIGRWIGGAVGLASWDSPSAWRKISAGMVVVRAESL